MKKATRTYAMTPMLKIPQNIRQQMAEPRSSRFLLLFDIMVH